MNRDRLIRDKYTRCWRQQTHGQSIGWLMNNAMRFVKKWTFASLVLLAIIGVLARPAISAYVTPHNAARQMQPLTRSTQLAALETNSPLLLQQGQQQYDAGQLLGALQSWREFAEDSSAQPLQQSLGWSYVSIVAQDLGDWETAESVIARSLSLLADYPDSEEAVSVNARVLNAQGRLHLKQGRPEMAWEVWTQAEAAYVAANDALGELGAQINQSQALQTMGLYRRARLRLEAVANSLVQQPDAQIKAIALKSLGTVLQTAGDLEKSREYLTESLELYKQLNQKADVADTLLALGNTLRLMGQNDAAQQHYQQVEQLMPESALSIQAQLNRFSLLLKSQAWTSAEALFTEILPRLKASPASRETIYNRVNFVESLLSVNPELNSPMTWRPLEEIADLLGKGAQQAEALQDSRAQSMALGELSKVYAYSQQWSDSQDLAERALSLSQDSHADIAYRWQQQLGRAYHAQGKDKEAVYSYTQAFDTLNQVRRDLLATNVEVQYSFRETIEPVYRELVSLLLLPDDVNEPSLMQAREVIESLQLAELENYFRSACIDSASEYIDRLDDTAAVLYPIILEDRVEVVVSLPGMPLSHYRTWQTEDETNQTLDELFQYFNPVLSKNKRLRLSKQVYDWLITPIENALAQSDVETLVFVLDGKFRNIPMAALHDGEQYLLEKYSVALTPGMKLLGPHFQKPKPLQALMLGLTEARSGFSALPGVRAELEQVSARVDAEVLFNEKFTRDNLAKEIDRVPFPVLHLATHGQFSSKLDETFLLAWDQKITISDLDSLLRARRQQDEPIELMVLSACQTAEGDDRATLGLAGMAIRSGARSTLATLWAVNDESTAVLMSEFYKELENSGISKAKALRQAQITVLKDPQFSHPFFWSPFVLIGNWLS